VFGLYITHPQVEIDPDIPVPKWGLSPLGRERSECAARLPWARQLRRIISSDETKAIETAEILAHASGIKIEIGEDMGENDRSATGFLVPDEFEKAANWFFAHPEQSFHGWERAVDAQARIVAAVDKVLADHDPSVPIAFVGHGGVGTLLKCHLAGSPIARDHDQPAGGGNLYAFGLRGSTIAL
jgi:broad specificity phosphatase PhoE